MGNEARASKEDQIRGVDATDCCPMPHIWLSVVLIRI